MVIIIHIIIVYLHVLFLYSGILDDEVNSKPLCAEPSKADQLSVCIFILLTFTSASVYTIINP